MKTFHFLAGLPRSGSTVLAALLNQHPKLHASATSGLGELMFNTFQAWKTSSAEQASSEVEQVKTILRSIMEARYSHIDKPIIIDKARNWAEATTVAVLKELLPYQPKIIATVRNVEDCAASFVRIAKPTNLEDFLFNSELIAHLKQSYQILELGYRSDKSCFLFVEYEDLLADPIKQLRKIEEFLGLYAFDYDLYHLDKTAPKERDEEIWKLPGLHDIKPELKKQHDQNSEDVLEHMYQSFVQPCFWRNQPPENTKVHPLNTQLSLSIIGNFEESEKILQELSIKEPKNHRVAFNRGWYELRKGHLLDGMTFINRGRIEKVFGNEAPKVPTPMWDGVQTGTALLNLEAGLGDQIHGLRFARELKKLGNQVIVACSGPLANTIRNAQGVDLVVQHEAMFGVVHDFWVPSMTAAIPLQWQYKDIDGSPYIPCPKMEKGDKIRIGLRWQGNPQFEHEQHRFFPSQFMFNAVKGLDVDYISLQRDAGSEHRPEWVKESDLSHWDFTARKIASCDLVITSCTSVAHLSAAMGVPTWIIIPLLPYYLWAKPGNGTEWYNSVKLFRQKKYGDWISVFNSIKKELHHAYENGLLDSNKKRTSVRRMGLQTIG